MSRGIGGDGNRALPGAASPAASPAATGRRGGFDRLPERPAARLALLAVALAYLLASLLQTGFIDHDVIVYGLIGRAIYELGLLPYDFAFDHKPFLTYFIYGALAPLAGRFSIFALMSFLVLWALALVLQRQALDRQRPVLLVLLVFCAMLLGSIDYSGNTEIYFMPLVLLAMSCALRAGRAAGMGAAWRGADFWLSALASVAAFNINYVTAVLLLPTVSFALWQGRREAAGTAPGGLAGFLRLWLAYLAASLAVLALALALLALAGMDLGSYFGLQHRFLAGYAQESPFPEPKFLALTLGPLLLVLGGALAGLRSAPGLGGLARCLVVLILASELSYLASGHYFAHYAFCTMLPFGLLLLCLAPEQRLARIALLAVLLLAAAGQLAKTAAWAARGAPLAPSYPALYAPLAARLDGAPVLPVHASVIPLFYAHARPLQPLVWVDHAEILYGAGADAYYEGFLGPQTRFAITSPGWCRGAGAGRPICAALLRDYDPVETRPGQGKAVGYTLYERRPAAAG